MNDHISLYQFLRSGASIYIALLEEMDIRPGPPGQQIVSLLLQVEETLWGMQGRHVFSIKFSQPESEIARLKFPDPIWGQISPRKGMRLLLVARVPSAGPIDPIYVEEISNADDPVLMAVRSVLDEETEKQDGPTLIKRYLSYLTSGQTVKVLFGAEALARDEDLPHVDETGIIAKSMAGIFAGDLDLYVRLSVGGWMWDRIFPRTNALGKASIINAAVEGARDPSEDSRRLSLDHLVMVAPEELSLAKLEKSPGVAELLKERLQQETSPEVREHISKLMTEADKRRGA